MSRAPMPRRLRLRPSPRVLGVLASLAVGAALAGCISLLPKSVPAQLYRFGATWPARTAPASPAAVGVLLEAVSMPRALTTDQILTVNGQEAAYVAGSRWVSPAVLLFSEAVQRAFDSRAQAVRLTSRGALGRSQASLRVTVRDFEVQGAPGATPTILVAFVASLTRDDGTVLGEREFSVTRPATEARVSAFAAAFDGATVEALDRLVDWTDGLAPGAAAAAPPLAMPTVVRRDGVRKEVVPQG